MRSSVYRHCFHQYARQIESTYAHLRALVAVLDRTPRSPTLVMEDDFGEISQPRVHRRRLHAHRSHPLP